MPEFIPARCGLPGCGEPLHMTWTSDYSISAGDTVGDLYDPANAHTATWHVNCEGGHTVLVPPPTGEDSYEFGRCTCEPGENDQHCEHNDLTRLRQVMAP